MCHICCIIAYTFISSRRLLKQGGRRTMLWPLDFPFSMIVIFHVYCSNMSYVVTLVTQIVNVYGIPSTIWMRPGRGLSESSCDAGMCRLWLVSVTLVFDYSLISCEMCEGLLLRYDFPWLRSRPILKYLFCIVSLNETLIAPVSGLTWLWKCVNTIISNKHRHSTSI